MYNNDNSRRMLLAKTAKEIDIDFVEKGISLQERKIIRYLKKNYILLLVSITSTTLFATILNSFGVFFL